MGETMQIINHYEAGLCFEPENEADFIEKTITLATNPEIYKKSVKGCEKLAQDFDRNKIAAQMLKTLHF